MMVEAALVFMRLRPTGGSPVALSFPALWRDPARRFGHVSDDRVSLCLARGCLSSPPRTLVALARHQSASFFLSNPAAVPREVASFPIYAGVVLRAETVPLCLQGGSRYQATAVCIVELTS